MFTMLMALAIVGGWQMFLTANVVNSLACYNCTSSNEDCSRDQVRERSIASQSHLGRSFIIPERHYVVNMSIVILFNWTVTEIPRCVKMTVSWTTLQ